MGNVMKKILYLSVILMVGISVISGYKYDSFKKRKVKEKLGQYESFPVTENKEFVIIIPSYNNEEWYEKNLYSVINQDYDNYRVIYIDDASKDDTYDKVNGYLQKHDEKNRVTLIHNEKNVGALANLYKAIHGCKDNEIIVTVDGDDWLAHEYVLTKLNESYANPNVWLTYGQYRDYPSYDQGLCRSYHTKSLIKKGGFRNHSWEASHLRTFYSALFKKIKIEDFFYEGQFLPMSWDLAFMIPMMEMAYDNIQFIKNYLYIYNRTNPISDGNKNREFQIKCDQYVRSLKKYERIDTLFEKTNIKSNKADLVIFSFDRPMQLYACIESINKYISGLGNISVIYRISNVKYEDGYNEVKKSFPEVNYVKQNEKPLDDFKPLLIQETFSSKNNHILFCVDDDIVKDYINLSKCIEALENTNAYGFYLKLGTHVDYCYTMDSRQRIPRMYPVFDDVYAWQFRDGEYDWKYPNTVDMTLYRKSDIEKNLRKLIYVNPNSFEGNWASKANYNKIGLCFSQSKIINIPMNLVNTECKNRHMNFNSAEQLLDKFNEGYKIDISKFDKVENKSVHVEYIPEFIIR